MAAHFHSLPVSQVTPDAAGSAAITFTVPRDLRDMFDFKPGQFVTVRAHIEGQETRRSYSICSPHQRFVDSGEFDIGIKPVEGGAFSVWALSELRPGMSVETLPPDGRFTPHVANAGHRVGFAAGSGITPMLSIIATTLQSEPASRFTLVYGNQRANTIMFNEALQDLKDRFPARLSLIHLLSRQAQDVELLNGRIDEAKVRELLDTLLPVDGIDEAFICGPEGMIEATQGALRAAGLPLERVHSERFLSGTQRLVRPRSRASQPSVQLDHRLEVILDGKTHLMEMASGDKVLDIALEAGLDLPYSCRGGVCCTCRARVMEGRVEMEKNFTLEQWEIDKGFVLTCQAHPLSERVVVSYDER